MTTPEPRCWNVWRHECGRWVLDTRRKGTSAESAALRTLQWQTFRVVAIVAASGTDPNDLPPGAVWSQVEVLGTPDVRA